MGQSQQPFVFEAIDLRFVVQVASSNLVFQVLVQVNMWDPRVLFQYFSVGWFFLNKHFARLDK